MNFIDVKRPATLSEWNAEVEKSRRFLAERNIVIAESEWETLLKINHSLDKFYAEIEYARGEGLEKNREEGIKIGENKARNEYQPIVDHLKVEIQKKDAEIERLRSLLAGNTN
jgi:flagellar biosynthesis/type III secretory pathway protein FliH